MDRSPDHTIGKLRLSATTDAAPLQPPEARVPRPLIVKLTVPPSKSGGMIVVSAEMQREGRGFSTGDVGAYFSAEAAASGAKAKCEPVLGQVTYPSSWQAWRMPVEAATDSRPLELSVTTTLGPEISLSFHGHFVPR